ncbi:flagellar basal body rod protein FlgF [Legionella sp. W05-934-2]|uniref:flagellar basal body rod protein FlgF n=1 Tax=Legionella sp. W05-934-2 TaxID=1198649 RepID=UPI003462E250
MDPVLYNAINGAKLDLDRQSVGSHNLANLNTPGFKQDLVIAESMLLSGPLGSTQSMVVGQRSTPDLTPGTLMTTGRELDVAVLEGWFAVQGKDGKESYTQAGNFRINENGTLTTATGQPVLGDGGPIAIPPAEKIDIGTDGTISILPIGANPNELAVLDRLKLVKIDNQEVIKDSEGLIRLKNGGVIESDPNLQVQTGALISSNTNAIEQMVNMIEHSREYEQLMKDVQSLKENSRRLAQLLQL